MRRIMPSLLPLAAFAVASLLPTHDAATSSGGTRVVGRDGGRMNGTTAPPIGRVAHGGRTGTASVSPERRIRSRSGGRHTERAGVRIT